MKKGNDRMGEKNSVYKIMPLMMMVMICSASMLNAFSVIPSLLSREFGLPAAVISRQTVAITLAMGVGGIAYASLADYISIRKLLLAGISILTIGAFMGFFFHENFTIVVIASAIEIFGGQCSAATMLLAAVRYLSEERCNKYYGYYIACINCSQLLGVLLGGVVSSYVGWKYIFLVPLFSLMAVPGIVKYMPEDSKLADKKLDILGIGILSMFAFFLTFFFNGQDPLFLIIAVLLGIALVFYVKYRKNAFVKPDFFKNKKYTTTIILGGLINSLLVAYPFTFSFLAAALYGLESEAVSVILLPSYLAAMVVAGFVGRITARLGIRKSMLTALFVSFAALVVEAVLVEKGVVLLIICSCVFSGGLSLYSPAVQALVFQSLPADKAGVGSGIYGLIFNVGMALGAAIAGAMLGSRILQKNAMIPGVGESASIYSNILLIFSGVMVLGAIIVTLNRETLFGKRDEKSERSS